MAEGFKIADAYIDVEARYDRREVEAAARVAGESAGAGFSESSARTFRRDSKGRFRKDVEEGFDDLLGEPARTSGERQGRRWGRSILSGMGRAVSSVGKGLFTDKLTGALGGGLMSFVKSPVGLGAILTAAASIGTLLASGIATTLSAALAGGFGLGIIGLGAFLLREDKGIQTAAKKLAKNATKVFTDAAKPMAKPFADALNLFNSSLLRLKPQIDAIFAALAPAILPLAQGMVGFVEALAPALVQLSGVAATFLTALAAKLPGIGASIAGFISQISTNWPAIQAGFFAFMSDVGSVISVLAKAFIWLAKNYQEIRDWTARLVQAAQPAITLTKLIYNAFKWLYDVLVGNSIVPDLVNGIIRWFGQLPGRVMGVLASLPGRVVSLFVSLATQLGARTRTMVSNVVSTLSTLPGRAYSAVAGVVGRISNILGSAASTARARAGQLVSGFVGVLAGLPGKAAGQANRVRGAIVGAFGGAAGWLRSAGSRIMDGLVGGIQAGIGRVRGLLNSVTGMIPDWKGPPEKDSKLLRDNGRRIITGFRRGLADEIPRVKSDLQGLTAAVPSVAPGAGAAPAGAAGATGGGVTIENLILDIDGFIDFSDPLAVRRLTAKLFAALKQFEREYA